MDTKTVKTDDKLQNNADGPSTSAETCVNMVMVNTSVDTSVSVDKSNLEEKPKHVNQRTWEKYQELKKQREAIAKKNADRMQKKIEKQKQNLKEAEAESAVEQESQQGEHGAGKDTSSRLETQWEEVQGYLHCNDHIKGLDQGKYAKKGALEERIDIAVRQKDFETAEKLSDKIATNEFGRVVTEAFHAKAYSAKRKQEEDEKCAKKKKRLPWGFEHKERWETKGNM